MHQPPCRTSIRLKRLRGPTSALTDLAPCLLSQAADDKQAAGVPRSKHQARHASRSAAPKFLPKRGASHNGLCRTLSRKVDLRRPSAAGSEARAMAILIYSSTESVTQSPRPA